MWLFSPGAPENSSGTVSLAFIILLSAPTLRITIMKSKLAASVSPLFVGEWRRNIRDCISSASKFTIFNEICPSVGSFQCQGLESSGRAVHTSSVEDDFSELGPPVRQDGAAQLKLVTEKREPYLKANPAGKAAASWSFSPEERHSIKDIIRDIDKFSHTSKIKLQDHNDTSTSAVKMNNSFKVDSTMIINQKKSQKLDSSCSISIENLPSTVDLSDLVQAISVFGKVSSASFRSVPGGLDCCDVVFENSESSGRAVLAGGIKLKSIDLPIRPLHFSEIVIIRIEGIGKETTDPAIHCMCQLIGALEGLAMDNKDSVDAFFKVKNEAELQRIIERLNNTIIDDHCWSAYQLPSNSTSMAKSERVDEKSKLGLQLNNRLVELKRQLDSKKVYFEDLQLLHMGILHLQGLPTTNDP